ncbi:MAG: two-component system sensor histidine kinase NtrB [Myxococcaceae bacterium]
MEKLRPSTVSRILFACAGMSFCFAVLAAVQEQNFRGPFVVRSSFPALLLLGALTTRALKGRALRWVFFATGLVSLALCSWSVTRGAHDLLMIVLLAPLIITVVIPEERLVGLLLGLSSTVMLGVVTTVTRDPMRVLWLAQSVLIIGMSELAGRRLRGLGRTISADSDRRFARVASALVETSKGFARLQDESSVFDLAVQSLSKHGMHAQVLKREADGLRMVAHTSTTPAAIAAALSTPVSLSAFPHLQPLLERHQTLYYPNVRDMIDRLLPQELAKLAKSNTPRAGVDAAILVRGKVYGTLSVQAPRLARTSMATLELFAQHIGAAIENIEQHRALAEQVVKITELQKELVSQARRSMLGAAAAVVSHEIRNPLGAIVNAVHLLKRGADGAELLAMIQSEAMRLDKLVHDLLLLARPLEPRHQPVELGALVERAIAVIGREGDRISVQTQPARAEGDPDQVELAVVNLLRTALEASGPESGVDVRVGEKEDRPFLAVEDHGSGVREEDLARIFEPFFTTRATGTGLGLAIVRRVVQAHQGSVGVTRSASGGACFTVFLPPPTQTSG